MGFTDDYWDRTDEEMLRDFYDWDAPQLEGITLDLLKEKGWARLNVGLPGERAPHAEGNFKTASGKCEFKSSMAANGDFVIPVWRSMYEGMQSGTPIDPLPDYVPPYESPASNPVQAERFPLNIISPKPHAFLNSQYANEAHKKQRQGALKVLIHPLDAAARGIAMGEPVRVYNDRGSFEGPAELSEDVVPGLVLANVGHWTSVGSAGASVNAISSDKHCSFGQAGTYSDNLVEVEKVAVPFLAAAE